MQISTLLRSAAVLGALLLSAPASAVDAPGGVVKLTARVSLAGLPPQVTRTTLTCDLHSTGVQSGSVRMSSGAGNVEGEFSIRIALAPYRQIRKPETFNCFITIRVRINGRDMDFLPYMFFAFNSRSGGHQLWLQPETAGTAYVLSARGELSPLAFIAEAATAAACPCGCGGVAGTASSECSPTAGGPTMPSAPGAGQFGSNRNEPWRARPGGTTVVAGPKPEPAGQVIGPLRFRGDGTIGASLKAR